MMVGDVSVQVKKRSSMLQECGNRHHLALTRVDKDQVSRMCEDRDKLEWIRRMHLTFRWTGLTELCMRDTAGGGFEQVRFYPL